MQKQQKFYCKILEDFVQQKQSIALAKILFSIKQMEK